MTAFSPENVRKAVHASLDEAMRAVPKGKRSAVLIDATNERVQLLLAIKAGDSWQFTADATYDGSHVAGHVSLLGSWD